MAMPSLQSTECPRAAWHESGQDRGPASPAIVNVAHLIAGPGREMVHAERAWSGMQGARKVQGRCT